MTVFNTMTAFVPMAGQALIAPASRASAAVTTRSSRFVGAFAASRPAAPFARFSMQMVDDEEPGMDDMDMDRRPPPEGEVEETKLFVGNLSWGSTDESLGDAFAEFGEVIDSKVVVDRFTGKSRGFGFITFAEADAADAALESMNGCEVDGRPIRLDRANKRANNTRPPRRNFY